MTHFPFTNNSFYFVYFTSNWHIKSSASVLYNLFITKFWCKFALHFKMQILNALAPLSHARLPNQTQSTRDWQVQEVAELRRKRNGCGNSLLTLVEECQLFCGSFKTDQTNCVIGVRKSPKLNNEVVSRIVC